jgi:CBS-domain-containing membrane protein
VSTPVRQLVGRLEQAEGGLQAGAWSAVVCVVGLAVVGALGVLLKEPWVFPSLGPTLMVLAETPGQPAAHPRSVLVGHVVGVAAGYLALLLTGLRTHPTVLQEGLSWPRVVAACLSVAVTTLVLQALRSPHPPSGATTLIVSLGLFKTASSLGVLLLSVLVCTVVAVVLNLGLGVRHAGVRGG